MRTHMLLHKHKTPSVHVFFAHGTDGQADRQKNVVCAHMCMRLQECMRVYAFKCACMLHVRTRMVHKQARARARAWAHSCDYVSRGVVSSYYDYAYYHQNC